MNRRYWLFCGMDYYPRGGMYDFSWAYDDISVLKEAARVHLEEEGPYRWAHIFDTETQNIIWDSHATST